MNNISTIRKQLRDAGFDPIPVRGKDPGMKKDWAWQKIENPSDEQIAMWSKAFPDAINTGILTKRVPCLDIDVLVPQAADAVEALAREYIENGTALVRFGLAPKRAMPFRVDIPFGKISIAYQGADGTRQGIEFLGNGQQIVVDGIHKDTHQPYRWHGGNLYETPIADLPLIDAKAAGELIGKANTLLVNDFGYAAPKTGSRAGTRRNPRPLGLDPYGEPTTFLGRVNQAALANLDKWVPKLFAEFKFYPNNPAGPTYRVSSKALKRDYEEDLSITPTGITDWAIWDQGDSREGRRSCIDLVLEWGGAADIKAAALWLCEQIGVDPGALGFNGAADGATGLEAKASRRKESIHSWDEPDISLLDDRRGDDLPDFPLAALCSNDLQDWVKRAAHGAGTAIEHVVVPLLGIAAGIVGTARRVRASRSWSQPMTIWTANVAYSGDGKTPGLEASKGGLTLLEKNNKPKNAELKRKHEARAEAAKAAYAEWKEELKTARENGEPLPDKPAEADEVGNFVEPRLFVSNATIERLAMLLQARPQGMLMLADELSAIFLNMSRYTSGQDNEFWLESWNGGGYSIERVGRPAISLDHLMIGLVGGLQPDKLVACFDGAQDGMYARMLFAWPGKRPFRPLTDMVSEIEPEIVNAFDRLNNLGGDGPDKMVVKAIPITAEARTVLEGLRQHVDTKIDLLEGRERDWWAKLPAHALRLTGTLCLLNWAWCGGPEPTEIGADYMRAGVQLGLEYFWPHARACLRLVGISEQHSNARRVLRWIKATGGDEVSREVIRRDALGRTLNADATQSLLDHLEQAGWLSKTNSKPSGAGRPAHRWHVNPRLAG
jgi:hypothetical protein